MLRLFSIMVLAMTVVFALLPHIVWLVMWIAGKAFRFSVNYTPYGWTAEVIPDTDIPLTLSGHTHGAQIRLFGWTPASWVFKETCGRYDKGNQTLYVNIGLGCTAPVRFGANPEITVMTLRNKE